MEFSNKLKEDLGEDGIITTDNQENPCLMIWRFGEHYPFKKLVFFFSC